MGNGVAFLPEISVEDEIARGELVRIPVQELRVHRKLRLIYRKSAALSHAGRAFLKIAESPTPSEPAPTTSPPPRSHSSPAPDLVLALDPRGPDDSRLANPPGDS